MFFGIFYENGYLYWFVVHNLQTKISGKLSYIYIFCLLHLNVLNKQPWNLWCYNSTVFLHRELERKVEKVKHMKLEVMRPKTKNNMNFQPE